MYVYIHVFCIYLIFDNFFENNTGEFYSVYGTGYPVFLKIIQVNSTLSTVPGTRVQVNKYFTVYMTCTHVHTGVPISLAFFISFSVVLLEEEQRDFFGVYRVGEQAHDFLVVGQTPSFLVAGVLLKEEQWVFLGDHPVVVLDLSFLALRISCYCF